MRTSNLLLALVLATAMGRIAVADRCLGVPAGQIVWCDDFDNYCTGGATWTGYPTGDPLAFPPACPTDGTAVADNAAFLANWTLPFNSGYIDNQSIDITNANTPPFSLKYRGEYAGAPVPTNLASSRRVFGLQPAINAKSTGKNAINGTDQNPLKLQFVTLHNPTGGDPANAIWFAELALDQDHAPTDYVKHACDTNFESYAVFPIICQQNQAVTECPPLSTTAHASIAVGFLAAMDPIPCNVETGRRPTNYHLAVFDGLKWWALKSNIFPGIGDFNVGTGGVGQLYMEVRTSKIFVAWDSVAEGVAEHSEATIPRQYLGPFDRISSGPGPGCELNATEHTCKGTPDYFKYCDSNPKWCWHHTWVDSMVVSDGVPVDARGACCQNNSCSLTSESECTAAGGVFRGLSTVCDASSCTGACCQAAGVCNQTAADQCSGSFRGIGTTCDTVGVCPCPTPFANWDFDTDVDMDDFAALQRCLSVGDGQIPGPAQCSCFDVTGGPNGEPDGQVDADDVQRFILCGSGKGVPWTSTTGCLE